MFVDRCDVPSPAHQDENREYVYLHNVGASIALNCPVEEVCVYVCVCVCVRVCVCMCVSFCAYMCECV